MTEKGLRLWKLETEYFDKERIWNVGVWLKATSYVYGSEQQRQ
jgi:hypothetical protein